LCAFLLAASTVDESKVEPIPSPRERILEWAEVMDENPDPKIVLSADVRAAMLATKLPWKVRHKESGIEMLLVPAGEFASWATPMIRSDFEPRAWSIEAPAARYACVFIVQSAREGWTDTSAGLSCSRGQT